MKKLLIGIVLFCYLLFPMQFIKTISPFPDANIFIYEGVEVQGGYVITGSIKFDNDTYSRVFVAKLDKDLNFVWTKVFDLGGDSLAARITNASNGNVAVCGDVTLPGKDKDMFFLLINANGTLLANTTIGGTNEELCRDITETSDHAFLLVGRTFSYISYGSAPNVFVVKLNVSQGNVSILWSKDYDLTGSYDAGYVGMVLNSSYVFVCSSWKSATTIDSYFCKISPNDGTLISCNPIAQLPYWDALLFGIKLSNGLLFTGGSDPISSNTNHHQAFIVKTDLDGNVIWQKRYDFPTNASYALGAKELEDGNIIICGRTEGIGWVDESMDGMIMLINGDGAMIWNHTFGGSEIDDLRFVSPTSDGFLFLGSSRSFDDHLKIYAISTNLSGHSCSDGPPCPNGTIILSFKPPTPNNNSLIYNNLCINVSVDFNTSPLKNITVFILSPNFLDIFDSFSCSASPCFHCFLSLPSGDYWFMANGVLENNVNNDTEYRFVQIRTPNQTQKYIRFSMRNAALTPINLRWIRLDNTTYNISEFFNPLELRVISLNISGTNLTKGSWCHMVMYYETPDGIGQIEEGELYIN